LELRSERVIGAARLTLGMTAFAGMLEPGTTVLQMRGPAAFVGLLFVVYSLLICVWLLVTRRLPAFVPPAMLAADLIWFSALIFVGSVGENPYPLLYVFVLLSAGLRWGMRETLASAGVCSLLSVMLPLTVAQLRLPLSAAGATAVHLDLEAILLRTAALLVVGYLVGYLSEREKRVKRGLQELAQTLAGSRVDDDLGSVVASTLANIRGLYRARRVTALFYDVDEEELTECTLTAGNEAPVIGPVSPVRAEEWVNFEDPHVLPPSVVKQLGSRKFEWTHFAYGAHLGWLFVVEPRLHRVDDEGSLQEVGDRMGPILDKMFLLRRLRRETIEEERNRIAHDFHDGPLQSFYSFELYLEVLQHWLEKDPRRAAAELAGLREAARKQAIELREFVRNMRPVDVEAGTLLTQLRALAEDMQKSSNLSIRVLADAYRIRARRRLCREIFQIVREALNNVWKHANADHAIVTLEQTEDAITITVDDNGRGFNFTGRYGLAALDAQRLGPVSIKQRVRGIGGELIVDSQPGLGTKLMVRVPLRLGAAALTELAAETQRSKAAI